jgi:hypothetical protein
MRNVLVILFLIFSLQGCKKDSSELSNLERCPLVVNDNKWYVVREVKNQTGEIYLNPDSPDNMEVFLLILDGKYEYVPCNLPQEFKIKDRNSKVTISGRIYDHKNLDYAYAPIELTSIVLSN